MDFYPINVLDKIGLKHFYANSHIIRAGIAQFAKRLGYGLDNRGIGVQFLTAVRDLSLLRNVQADSGAHPDHNRHRGLFPRG
jgi:hypothetical protein